ncbi:TetR family transcriptional regulator [Micromonospora sp. NPDC005220]|uniref:TetR/AcrR family transcriptional regulator n=1 Tax=Micromonospora sp. NPDC005220 TaxID=3155589 RepID=UPI0033A034B9
MSSVRLHLLDCAIAVIAERGLAALSHRAVEERAGFAHGATTYHFRTRRELLLAVLRRLGEREQRTLAVYLGGRDVDAVSGDPQALRDLLVHHLQRLIADRADLLARYELFLHAARNPDLQPEVQRWRAVFAGMAQPLLAALGAPDPAAAAPGLMAGLEGFLFGQLVDPRPADPARVRAHLDALLHAWTI